MDNALTKKQIEWLKQRGMTTIPRCLTCGAVSRWVYNPSRFTKYCNAQCRNNDPNFHILLKQIKGEKYGDENYSNRQKAKQTCLEKYNTETFSNRTKAKQTCLKRYGVDNPRKSSLVKTKIKQTKLEKYNNENYSNRQKAKQTCLEKYGVQHVMQVDDIKHKVREQRSLHMDDIIQKMKLTSIKRYGIDHIAKQHQRESFELLNDMDWLYDQYITKNKTSVQIANDLSITSTAVCNYLRYHEITIRQHSQHSYKSIQWLDYIMEQEGIFIQHAGNIGEYQIPGTRYKADGYCKETNTVYEFYGDYWHGNPDVYESELINETTNCTMGELYQRTIKKECKLIELGYNLITIWEFNLNRQG